MKSIKWYYLKTLKIIFLLYLKDQLKKGKNNI